MIRRPKVLLFTIRDLSLSQDSSKVHGSILWTANLLQCLAQVPDMDFTVVSSGPRNDGVANQEFVKALGLAHSFVPFSSSKTSTRNTKLQRTATTELTTWQILMDKYYFMCEREYRHQMHVDAGVMRVIKEQQPDLIVFNEIYSALCAPSVFSLAIPRCLISVNNEVHFHRTMKSSGGAVGEAVHRRLKRWLYRHANWISNRRFLNYMNDIYSRCNGIVSLTHSDLPDDLPNRMVRAVIPPIFQKSDLQWGYQGSRSVFFVGNIWIYSNRFAMEWLCRSFAPELSKIDAAVRINIIGANLDQVPRDWQLPNINFMGYSNKDELTRLMTTADLFIAPIANPFGAKLKLAECVAHATPFLATDAAMSGVPFRSSMPQIDLDQPAAAARIAMEYINRPESLTKLSQSISAHARQARTDQIVAWSTFLNRSLETTIKGAGLTQDNLVHPWIDNKRVKTHYITD